VKGPVSKINHEEEYLSKNEQLPCIRIEFIVFFIFFSFKQTLLLDRFLKLAFVPDRFFIREIDHTGSFDDKVTITSNSM